MTDTTKIANRLDDRFTRPQLNQKAAAEYGIDDPVGYETKAELIEAMIAADPARAAADAGLDAPEAPEAPERDATGEGDTNTPGDPETASSGDDSDADGDDAPVTMGEITEALDGLDEAGKRQLAEKLEISFVDDPTEAELDAAIMLALSDDGTEEEEPTELPEGIVLVVGNGAGNRVALWEQHRDHPGGEVFIKGGQRATAAYTPKVQRAEKYGKVRVVDGK